MIQPNKQSTNRSRRPPLVTIIVPVKNSTRFLSDALLSIMEQTYPHFEIVVVDGHSSDGTRELVQDFARHFDQPLTIITQTGDGLASARNIGIEKARGDLIAFLDSDDRWDAAKLQLQVYRLWNDPALQYCLGWLRFFLEPETQLRPGFRLEMFDHDRVGYTPGTLLARRKLFQTLGGFDPALAVGCDADWFARALDRKIEMDIVPEAILFKRIHGRNLSARVDLYRREMLTVLKQSVRRKRKEGLEADWRDS